MSIVPYLVNELLSQLESPSIYEHPHSLPLSVYFHPHERMTAPLRAGYLRPWQHRLQNESGISNIKNDKDSFKVSLDVQQFKPEELNVKVVDDYICIEGKHEERSDEHGFVSRHFTRRYKIPANVDKQALTSSLSSDGVLELYAPKLAIEGAKEKAIPIVQTNQPAVKSVESKTEKAESKTEKAESKTEKADKDVKS